LLPFIPLLVSKNTFHNVEVPVLNFVEVSTLVLISCRTKWNKLMICTSLTFTREG
jgi:hypothetical protein